MSEAQEVEKDSGLPLPLQSGEEVLQTVRRHWLYLWPNIGLKLLLAFVPPAIIAFLLSAAGIFEGTVERIFWILVAVYAIYSIYGLFITWYRYHNDLWVVTSQRIIDSFKRHPFNLRLSTADLVNVQDMTVSRNGVLQTAFDYGDIIFQTASGGVAQSDFRITGIPHPREVHSLVDRERDRERQRIRSGET
jgi:hypothetical protein